MDRRRFLKDASTTLGAAAFAPSLLKAIEFDQSPSTTARVAFVKTTDRTAGVARAIDLLGLSAAGFRGKDLFVKKIESEQGREQTINVSSWGQLGLAPILDLYLRRIERDEKGLPIKLYPIRMSWPGDLNGEPPKVVVIDPAVSSGRPVVNGTGVMAEIIVGRFNTGEGIESIAEDYGLKQAQVEEVIRYAPAA